MRYVLAALAATLALGFTACSSPSLSEGTRAPTVPATIQTTPPETTPESSDPPTDTTVPESTAGQSDAPRPPAGSENGASKPPPKSQPKPINILILGSDSRTPRGECFNIQRGRADAIHIVSVDPKTGAGTIVNIPRDAWVYIPGLGMNKINAAMAYGGPALMTETVERLTGIPITSTAVTSFCGLREVVKGLGGIVVYVPQDLDDTGAIFYGRNGCPGLTSLKRGWQELNGCEALYFTRNRHDFAGGDFARTANQATVLKAILVKFQKRAATPADVFRIARIIRENVVFTPKPSLKGILDLARLARTLKPGRLESITLKGYSGWAGRASVVYLSSINDNPSDSLFRDIKSDAVVNGR